jgi:MOSC domain-containing protein YiiM
MKQGTVRAVCISVDKGERKKNIGKATLVENHGLAHDAHAGDWHRQVSLLTQESIAKMQAAGLDVGAGDFAENLTTEGLDLCHLPIGTRLAVGDTCLLEVTQIGKVCHDRCAIFYQAGDCVMPREGIFARVLTGGDVTEGDGVRVFSEPEGV